jgi:hypothetical protein
MVVRAVVPAQGEIWWAEAEEPATHPAFGSGSSHRDSGLSASRNMPNFGRSRRLLDDQSSCEFLVVIRLYNSS